MASIPVYNPRIPFTGVIPGGLRPSLMVRMKGRMTAKKGRCTIDFVSSPAVNSDQDIMFHMSIRMDEKCIVRNSFQNGHWKGEERYGAFRIGFGDPFEIIILAELEFYKIAINGVHLGVFRHRLPLNLVQYIHVAGDVHVEHILFEQDVKSAQEHAKLGHVIATAIGSTPTVHTHHVISASVVPTHQPIHVTSVPVHTHYEGITSAPIYASHDYDTGTSAPIYASHESHMIGGASAPIYTSSAYPSLTSEMEVIDSQIHASPSAPPIYSSYEPPPVYESHSTTWVNDDDY